MKDSVDIDNDLAGMTLALEWAAKGLYTTSPNPHIGCVIVKDGRVIGAGVTQPAGYDHAEIQALKDAAARGHDVRGATAYVTLEPCNHHGRTPPCSDALVRASLGGMTALHNGQSQWITGAEARADGHAWRARACAILTGIGTVKEDDPQLNVRAVETPRQPRRIVVDSRLDISPTARVLAGGGTWIVAAVRDPDKEAALTAAGAEIIVLPNAGGKVDLPELMRELGRRQINELHVEAGGKLNGSLIREGCVDELLVYLAPTVLGDAQRMFALPALTSLDQQQRLKFHEVKQIGADLRILARFPTHNQ